VSTLRSVGEVADAVRAAQAALPGRRIVAGIAGPPGAGKSTLAAAVVEALGPNAVLLPMDGYHVPQAQLVQLGQRQRMGAPDTFDVAALLATLKAIVEQSGVSVWAPAFDRDLEEPVPHAIEISPDFSTVVAEGNYLLLDAGAWRAVARYLDVTFYLEIDEEVRLERLIARHERYGKSPAEARAWALGPDESNARLIASTAHRANHRVRLRQPVPEALERHRR
jgi:pantothenate kinase